MSQALAKVETGLRPASPEMVERVAQAQAKIAELPQVEVQTEHVLHGGMYSRTIKLAPRVVIVGATIKVATLLIIHGDCMVLAGDEWVTLKGFNVIPGHPGRKGVFVTASEVNMTMIFPTNAKTVAEAEEQFTDEADKLLSRRQGDDDLVLITGVEPCPEQ